LNLGSDQQTSTYNAGLIKPYIRTNLLDPLPPDKCTNFIVFPAIDIQSYETAYLYLDRLQKLFANFAQNVK